MLNKVVSSKHAVIGQIFGFIRDALTQRVPFLLAAESHCTWFNPAV